MIKEYFANYYLHSCDVTFDMSENRMEVHQSTAEPWRVTLVDTGGETMTGGRLRRALSYVEGDDAFCFTYGDGLADIDMAALDRLPSRRAARSRPSRRCSHRAASGRSRSRATGCAGFREKPRGDGGWINGGLLRAVAARSARYLEGDDTVWEDEPLAGLARDGQLACLPASRLLAGDGHAQRTSVSCRSSGRPAERPGRRGSRRRTSGAAGGSS